MYSGVSACWWQLEEAILSGIRSGAEASDRDATKLGNQDLHAIQFSSWKIAKLDQISGSPLGD